MTGGSRIGASVAAMRRERGLSQEDLARVSGLTRVEISKIEGGRNKASTVRTRTMLARGFGMTVDQFDRAVAAMSTRSGIALHYAGREAELMLAGHAKNLAKAERVLADSTRCSTCDCAVTAEPVAYPENPRDRKRAYRRVAIRCAYCLRTYCREHAIAHVANRQACGDLCALCSGAVEPRTGTGREVTLSTGPYRVPDDYGMPTCIDCGAEWITGDTIFDLIKLRTAAAGAAFGKANRKE